MYSSFIKYYMNREILDYPYGDPYKLLEIDGIRGIEKNIDTLLHSGFIQLRKSNSKVSTFYVIDPKITKSFVNCKALRIRRNSKHEKEIVHPISISDRWSWKHNPKQKNSFDYGFKYNNC